MRFPSIVAIALLVVACGGTSPTPSPAPSATRAPVDHVISGTVVRHGAAADTYSEANMPGPDNTFPCAGTDDFADVDTDAPIVVSDQAGSVLGQATLADDVTGTYDKFPKAVGGLKTARVVTQCFYTFQFDVVPDADSYTIKVGNQDGATFSADELALRGWTVALTIGA
jgi:hypothetical protein